MRWIEITLAVVGICATSLSVYCAGVGVVPFLLGLRSVCVSERRAGRRALLRVRSLDAVAMHVTGYALFATVPLLMVFGKPVALASALGSLIFWSSLRVVFETDGAQTLLSRRFLWIIPWRHRRHQEGIEAWTDGWGDFADPEALHVRAGEESVELGWSHQGSDHRADELVTQINAWQTPTRRESKLRATGPCADRGTNVPVWPVATRGMCPRSSRPSRSRRNGASAGTARTVLHEGHDPMTSQNSDVKPAAENAVPATDTVDPRADVPRPELTEEARRAEERAKAGKPVRGATREPSMVSLDRAADEGMVPAKDDE